MHRRRHHYQNPQHTQRRNRLLRQKQIRRGLIYKPTSPSCTKAKNNSPMQRPKTPCIASKKIMWGAAATLKNVGPTITTSDETAMMMAALQDTHAKQLHCMQEANDKAMEMAKQAMQNRAEQMKMMQETSARQVSPRSFIPGTVFTQ